MNEEIVRAWNTAHEASTHVHESPAVVQMIAAMPDHISVDEAQRRARLEPKSSTPVTLERVIAASWSAA